MMAEETKAQSSIHIVRAEQEDKATIMALAAAEDHAESIFGDLKFSEAKFSTLFEKSIDQPGRCITLKAETKGRSLDFFTVILANIPLQKTIYRRMFVSYTLRKS